MVEPDAQQRRISLLAKSEQGRYSIPCGSVWSSEDSTFRVLFWSDSVVPIIWYLVGFIILEFGIEMNQNRNERS